MKKFLKFLKFLAAQKGQTLVLYALLVPLLFMVGAAGVDLGWYYYNVAKLQNAADAAAMAGAMKLEGESPKLINLNNEDRNKLTKMDDNESANSQALEYLQANWDTENKPITNDDKFSLYEDDENNFYYIVKLESDFTHLFSILNSGDYSLGKVSIGVNSVAELTYSNNIVPDAIKKVMEKLETESVINGNWELEDARRRKSDADNPKPNAWKKPANPNNNMFIQMAIDREYDKYNLGKVWLNYNSSTNTYTDGEFYRYAKLDVDPGNGKKKTDGGKGEKYPDSLNLGFRQDIVRVEDNGALKINDDGSVSKVKNPTTKVFEEDWDIRNDEPYNKKTEVLYINQNESGGVNTSDNNKIKKEIWKDYYDLRIHNIFNFNKPFEVRTGRPEDRRSAEEKKNNPNDILWTRIESEAMIPLDKLGITDKGGHREFKSVRQIIININKYTEDENGRPSYNTVTENGKFKYRPVVFFYRGPEKIDMDTTLRDSKPIILNLNADFIGALYAPYSPVILTGTGKFQGFIVAKEYHKLKTGGGHEVTHKDNDGNVLISYYVDGDGEVLSEVLTERETLKGYGKYSNLGITLEEEGYTLPEKSSVNLFVYSE